MATVLNIIFSPCGRIGRLTFWKMVFALYLFGILFLPESEPDNELVWLAAFGGAIALIWSWFVICLKRLRDRNKSGWWLFLVLVPVAGPLWLFIELGVFPGKDKTTRANPSAKSQAKSPPPPRKEDKPPPRKEKFVPPPPPPPPRDKPPPPTNDSEEAQYATILNLRGAPTKENIRSAYRQKVKEYHPDKVNHLGDELKALADEKMKRINEAYGYFKKKYSI